MVELYKILTHTCHIKVDAVIWIVNEKIIFRNNLCTNGRLDLTPIFISYLFKRLNKLREEKLIFFLEFLKFIEI